MLANSVLNVNRLRKLASPTGLGHHGRVDEEHYAEIERIRAQLDKAAERVDKLREELHQAVRAAFPETAGMPQQRGVLTEVARRSGWTREYVAQIRDGKATPKTNKEN